MKVLKTEIPGVVVIEPEVFGDDRGFFLESWHRDRYQAAGIPETFVQDNVSKSSRNVLRGLHFQYRNTQGKLVTVLEGEVFDVAVDIRTDSPTYGRWTGVTLSGKTKRQLYVPPGFAHGFCVTSDEAIFMYKCTDLYNPQAEATILWNDPEIGISWPVSHPKLSAKDRAGIPLKALPKDKFPQST